jgi:hypothetical protein
LLQYLASLRVSLESQNGDFIDGVQGFQVVRGRQSSHCHHPVDVLAFGYVGITDAEFVGRQGSRLIRTKNINTLVFH